MQLTVATGKTRLIVQCVERRNDNRKIFRNFPLPHFACLSAEETIEAVGPFYLASMRGEV